MGGPETLAKRFDLVLANLTANPLSRMASTMKNLVKPGGVAVLSGLLRDQADPVLAEYRKQGFRLAERRNDEEWSALVLSRSAVGPDTR